MIPTCKTCNVKMEEKGDFETDKMCGFNKVFKVLYQCPKCKDVFLLEKHVRQKEME